MARSAISHEHPTGLMFREIIEESDESKARGAANDGTKIDDERDRLSMTRCDPENA